MTKAEYLQNLRLGLEEANRWLRYIDNFFWILSSFWITGTGFAVSKAFEWKGMDGRVVIIGIIMIVAWILFLFFMQHTFLLSKKFIKRAKNFENELKIDVILIKPIKGGVRFKTIMIVVACSSIVIWCGFVVQFIVKN